MLPKQGNTVKYMVILIIAVVAILAFASFAHGQDSSEGQNDGQATNAQQDQKQQDPPSALPATQKQADTFLQLQDIALQREAVISNNVLAHQVKVNWENEQIYKALRDVLSYTIPSMTGDLDQWWNTGLGHPSLGNPGELQALDSKQIDMSTVSDPNWKKVMEKQNLLYLKQKEAADRQIADNQYEIVWLECYRQFLTRLAELLKPEPVSYAPASYSGGGGGGGAAAVQEAPKGADVVDPYVQNWGHDKEPEVVNKNGGAEKSVDDTFGDLH